MKIQESVFFGVFFENRTIFFFLEKKILNIFKTKFYISCCWEFKNNVDEATGLS